MPPKIVCIYFIMRKSLNYFVSCLIVCDIQAFLSPVRSTTSPTLQNKHLIHSFLDLNFHLEENFSCGNKASRISGIYGGRGTQINEHSIDGNVPLYMNNPAMILSFLSFISIFWYFFHYIAKLSTKRGNWNIDRYLCSFNISIPRKGADSSWYLSNRNKHSFFRISFCIN